MSEYIMLGKIPTSPEERKELIGKRVAMEDHLSNQGLSHVQAQVIDFLISKKGYSNNDIETNVEFKVEMSGNPACAAFDVKADIILKLNGKRFFLIKCVVNSPESWERHSVAFCRVVESCQIPYAAVTDAEIARVLDVINGKLLSIGLDTIPSKEEALHMFENTVFTPYSPEKSEKEKRILYAFDAITCAPTSEKH